MAITRNIISIRKTFQNTEISSKLALFLVIFSVICGLITFILCLVAESTKSEVTWLLLATPNSKENRCFYSGSGRTPLACAVAALLLLAVAMFCEHAYMLIAVTNPKQPAMAAWATVPQDRRATTTHRDLSWQACCLFLTTWAFFALSELLLMIVIGVESGHLSNYRSPRPSCHAIRHGVFAVTGVFALVTVFLGVGLYITALRTQKLRLREETTRNDRSMQNVASTYPHVQPSAPASDKNSTSV